MVPLKRTFSFTKFIFGKTHDAQFLNRLEGAVKSGRFDTLEKFINEISIRGKNTDGSEKGFVDTDDIDRDFRLNLVGFCFPKLFDKTAISVDDRNSLEVTVIRFYLEKMTTINNIPLCYSLDTIKVKKRDGINLEILRTRRIAAKHLEHLIKNLVGCFERQELPTDRMHNILSEAIKNDALTGATIRRYVEALLPGVIFKEDVNTNFGREMLVTQEFLRTLINASEKKRPQFETNYGDVRIIRPQDYIENKAYLKMCLCIVKAIQTAENRPPGVDCIHVINVYTGLLESYFNKGDASRACAVICSKLLPKYTHVKSFENSMEDAMSDILANIPTHLMYSLKTEETAYIIERTPHHNYEGAPAYNPIGSGLNAYEVPLYNINSVLAPNSPPTKQ